MGKKELIDSEKMQKLGLHLGFGGRKNSKKHMMYEENKLTFFEILKCFKSVDKLTICSDSSFKVYLCVDKKPVNQLRIFGCDITCCCAVYRSWIEEFNP